MNLRTGLWAAGLAVAAAIVAGPTGAQTPKRGGTLIYMIPADAPPSFDGHRETTFATVHATAPFYSVLIRVPPDNPASTTEFTYQSSPSATSYHAGRRSSLRSVQARCGRDGSCRRN